MGPVRCIECIFHIGSDVCAIFSGTMHPHSTFNCKIPSFFVWLLQSDQMSFFHILGKIPSLKQFVYVFLKHWRFCCSVIFRTRFGMRSRSGAFEFPNRAVAFIRSTSLTIGIAVGSNSLGRNGFLFLSMCCVGKSVSTKFFRRTGQSGVCPLGPRTLDKASLYTPPQGFSSSSQFFAASGLPFFWGF